MSETGNINDGVDVAIDSSVTELVLASMEMTFNIFATILLTEPVLTAIVVGILVMAGQIKQYHE